MGRVAVTGMGTINPLGHTLGGYANALHRMESGIQRIHKFDPRGETVQIAAEVRDFEPKQYMERKKARRYDPVIRYAIAAAKLALEDSGLDLQGDWKTRAAVTVSSAQGGFHTLLGEMEAYFAHGNRHISPFLIPMMISDMSAGVVAMEYGLQGPNFALVSACATSLHSIAVTAMMILHGYCTIGVCGGAEATIEPLPIAAFASMMALSRNNDNPEQACRPFDVNRDGFVMGEGAGVMVLEDETHAKERGGKIYGYIDGWGMSGDAYDFSANDPSGSAVCRAMEDALMMAKINPEAIDLVNCHATGTPTGDLGELQALQRLYRDSQQKPIIQSTKSLIGHGLGSAGANELIGCILQAQQGFIHGNRNCDHPDPKAEGFVIPTQTMDSTPQHVLKNALGFGGHNASVVFSRR